MAKHLSHAERRVIAQLASYNRSCGFIARQLGRARSTIFAELRRNTPPGQYYQAAPAHAMAKARARKPRVAAKMHNPLLLAYVQEKLSLKWSPEQISGRLRREHPQLCVSHETLYKWIWAGKQSGLDWHTHLRQARKKKSGRRRCGRDNRGRIRDRVSIDERPKSVDSRRFAGDWEGDTVTGCKRKSSVASWVERKYRYACLALVNGTGPQKVNAAIIERFARTPLLPIRTVTLDNGREFTAHMELSKAWGAKVYFAHPYHSWERGLNENTNGLLRQFYPKGTDFRQVTEEELARVEYLLNTRPRKCLQYRTPMEAMEMALARRRSD